MKCDIYKEQKNILLTSAPDGDYRITTRVRVSPTENYNGAALYVHQDDDITSFDFIHFENYTEKIFVPFVVN